MEITKKHVVVITVILILFTISLIILSLVILYSSQNSKISSFEECVEKGGAILESYPERCLYDGQSFTRKLTPEEEKKTIPPVDEDREEYYGGSTKGSCTLDSDCIINGCNSEICQNKDEEGFSSICVMPDRPTPLELGYECGCVQNTCQWNK